MENKKWNRIYAPADTKLAETENAVLLKMPYKSEYKDYKVWVSKHCVKAGRKEGTLLISFGDNWKFILFKEEKGEDGNYVKKDEVEIDAAKMVEAYKAVDASIRFKKEA